MIGIIGDTKYYRNTQTGQFYGVSVNDDYGRLILDDLKEAGMIFDYDDGWRFHQWNDSLISYLLDTYSHKLNRQQRLNFLDVIDFTMEYYDDFHDGLEAKLRDLGCIGMSNLFEELGTWLQDGDYMVVYGFDQGQVGFAIDTDEITQGQDWLRDLFFTPWYNIDEVDEHGEYIGTQDTLCNVNDNVLVNEFDALTVKSITYTLA